MYELQNGNYELLDGEIIWLSAVGLGIGKERGSYMGIFQKRDKEKESLIGTHYTMNIVHNKRNQEKG